MEAILEYDTVRQWISYFKNSTKAIQEGTTTHHWDNLILDFRAEGEEMKVCCKIYLIPLFRITTNTARYAMRPTEDTSSAIDVVCVARVMVDLKRL